MYIYWTRKRRIDMGFALCMYNDDVRVEFLLMFCCCWSLTREYYCLVVCIVVASHITHALGQQRRAVSSPKARQGKQDKAHTKRQSTHQIIIYKYVCYMSYRERSVNWVYWMYSVTHIRAFTHSIIYCIYRVCRIRCRRRKYRAKIWCVWGCAICSRQIRGFLLSSTHNLRIEIEKKK